MFETTKKLFCKDIDCKEIQFPSYIINRIISFDSASIKEADLMNKYTFTLPKDMWFKGMMVILPRRMPVLTYIKKPKPLKELAFFREALKKYYGWCEREIDVYWMFLTHEDKTEICQKFGFNKKECGALGVEYVEPDFKKEKNSLMEWL